jgi:hypothetical protein
VTEEAKKRQQAIVDAALSRLQRGCHPEEESWLELVIEDARAEAAEATQRKTSEFPGAEGNIYAAFTQLDARQGLVKIGVSKNPRARMHELQVGNGLPIVEFLHAPTWDTKTAFAIESRIHGLLKDRKSSGEWFRFDFSNPNDKRLFHLVTKTVYEDKVGRTLRWTREIIAKQNHRKRLTKNPR